MARRQCSQRRRARASAREPLGSRYVATYATPDAASYLSKIGARAASYRPGHSLLTTSRCFLELGAVQIVLEVPAGCRGGPWLRRTRSAHPRDAFHATRAPLGPLWSIPSTPRCFIHILLLKYSPWAPPQPRGARWSLRQAPKKLKVRPCTSAPWHLISSLVTDLHLLRCASRDAVGTTGGALILCKFEMSYGPQAREHASVSARTAPSRVARRAPFSTSRGAKCISAR